MNKKLKLDIIWLQNKFLRNYSLLIILLLSVTITGSIPKAETVKIFSKRILPTEI